MSQEWTVCIFWRVSIGIIIREVHAADESNEQRRRSSRTVFAKINSEDWDALTELWILC